MYAEPKRAIGAITFANDALGLPRLPIHGLAVAAGGWSPAPRYSSTHNERKPAASRTSCRTAEARFPRVTCNRSSRGATCETRPPTTRPGVLWSPDSWELGSPAETLFLGRGRGPGEGGAVAATAGAFRTGAGRCAGHDHAVTETKQATVDLHALFGYRDAPAAITWLRRAFGFDATMSFPDRKGGIAHAELRLGDAVVVVFSDHDG